MLAEWRSHKLMKILEKNREIIEKKYEYILEKIEGYASNGNVVIQSAANGEETIAVKRGEKLWYLNSRLNPEYAASVYAKRYHIRLYGIYFIFGLSDGRHVREILKNCDETNRIVVCEPDFDAFCMAAAHFDISDILNDERVILYIPDITVELRGILSGIIEYSKVGIIDFLILPGFDILHKEACETYMDSIIDKMQDVMVHRGTYMLFQRMIPQHTLYHMRKMISQSNHEQLRRALDEKDITNIPAIIVSAGPSLDKNVQELKKAQGKAFIMVVDAAVRTVIKAGIRPDMICTIDPESPDRFFDGLELKDMNWSCIRMTRPEVLKWEGQKIFYYGFFEKNWNVLIDDKLGYNFPDIPSGGSVSSAAFMLAFRLGFKKMILVGQDMAFTGGVSHTKGINEAFGDNDEYIKSRSLMQVEGNDGSILDTDFQMWYYLKWFERAIKLYENDFSVINATEGGAKIEGTEVIPLKTAIERECTGELNMYELARSVPPMFTEEQQKELFKELEKMPGLLEKFRCCVEDCIHNQKEILAEIKSGNYDIGTMKRRLSDVLTENAKLEQFALFDMIVLYAKKEEYEVGNDIYAKEDMGIDELLERNLMLCEGYRNAVDMFVEDFEEYVHNRN